MHLSVNRRPNGNTWAVSIAFRNNNLRILALFSGKARFEKKKQLGEIFQASPVQQT
jgi:hypothetical protein